MYQANNNFDISDPDLCVCVLLKMKRNYLELQFVDYGSVSD